MVDMRNERTKQEINRALEQLLKEIPFTKITINTLATRALIHHNTFYLHYPDKYALLEDHMNARISHLLSNSRDLLAHPFLAFEALYLANDYQNVFKIQRNDRLFMQIVADVFSQAFVSVIGDDEQKYFMLGRISGILTWMRHHDLALDGTIDWKQLDEIYTTQHFPKIVTAPKRS